MRVTISYAHRLLNGIEFIIWVLVITVLLNRDETHIASDWNAENLPQYGTWQYVSYVRWNDALAFNFARQPINPMATQWFRCYTILHLFFLLFPHFYKYKWGKIGISGLIRTCMADAALVNYFQRDAHLVLDQLRWISLTINSIRDIDQSSHVFANTFHVFLPSKW